MFIKITKHLSLSILCSVIVAIALFSIVLNSGVIFGFYFTIAGVIIGLMALFTKELSIALKNLIAIIALSFFYYLFNYLLFIELETQVPSVIISENPYSKAFTYLSNTTYKDFLEFWPLFKSKIELLDILFLALGLEGLFYLGWKKEFLSTGILPENEESNNLKTGDTLSQKRKVRSKRFKRRF